MGIFDNFVYKNGEIVDNNLVKWFHWGVPDEEGKERENGDYIVRGLNPQYGQDINIVIELITRKGRNVQIISGWKVHPLGMITCNTPLADD